MIAYCVLRKKRGRRTFSYAIRTTQYAISSQLPPLPILVMQKLLRLRAVDRFQVLRVPLEALAAAVGDVAEQDGLAERPGEFQAANRAGRAVFRQALTPSL